MFFFFFFGQGLFLSVRVRLRHKLMKKMALIYLDWHTGGSDLTLSNGAGRNHEEPFLWSVQPGHEPDSSRCQNVHSSCSRVTPEVLESHSRCQNALSCNLPSQMSFGCREFALTCAVCCWDAIKEALWLEVDHKVCAECLSGDCGANSTLHSLPLNLIVVL